MPETSDTSVVDAPIDPRVERSRRLICEAVLTELGEVGYGAMSIESIARRAGVGKATVYRHWNGKLDLLESALETVKDDMVLPDTGTVRERLEARLTWLAEYLASPDRSGALPAIVSAAVFDDSVRVFHRRFSSARREECAALVQEGIDSGELEPRSGSAVDSQLVAEMLVGPLFFGRLMSGESFSADRVVEILDLVFDSA